MLLRFILLLRFEYTSEKRKRNTLLTVLLYLACVFLVLVQIHQTASLDINTIVSIYWIIQLFLGVWISFESIQSENIKRMLFWHQYVPTRELFLVKSLYNQCLLLFFSNLLWFLNCFFFLPQYIAKWQLYILFSLVGICLSSVFTFVSHIVFYLQQQLGLAGVLGFPIIIPLLLITIKLVKRIVLENTLLDFPFYQYIPVYGLIALLAVFLGFFLIPYLKTN